jgi:hypothetical protein
MRTLLKHSAHSFLLCITAFVVGCGTETVQPDAAVPDVVAVDVPADKAVVDVMPPPPDVAEIVSQIYGPCRSDNGCETGLTCRTEATDGFPGGECNRECTSNDDCVLVPNDGSSPSDAWCPPSVGGRPRMCMRVCLNGIACQRRGYTCRTFNANEPDPVRACVPVCTDESCVTGTTCEHESGRCRPAGTMPVGRTIGQTCEPEVRMGVPTPPREMQCVSGLCNADWQPDSRGNRYYTGWNGGYCSARCILPVGFNSSDFWGEPMLPQANCPTNSLCLAFAGSFSRGDLGVCYQSCTANSDCRADQGYFCQKTIQLSATNTRRFTNGFCTPVNCLNTMTPCPDGLTCRRNNTGTAGSCVPPTMTVP